MSTLYLTGYEKETIDQFVKKLEKAGITTVIDVREIPLSRKNSFSKINLSRILSHKGIHYFHLPELGSPSTIRYKLKHDKIDYLEFFNLYRKYVVSKSRTLSKVIDILKSNGTSCLLCFERNSDLCHRSIVASELLKINQNLRVIPL